MKNMKKFVAIATALTMAMAPMTAFADTIGGDVNYVDTTIYKVTLPTTQGMGFTLDPQGLASLDEGGEHSDENAGDIIGVGTMTAVNESSVDVTLSAKFYIVDSSGEATLSDTTISSEEANEIAMVITSDVADVDASENDFAVTANAEEDATAVKFDMAAATYTFTKTDDGYAYVLTPDSGSKVNMTIGGKVAKDADWSAYTGADAETITLNVVFEFLDGEGETIEVEEAVENRNPSISSTATYDASEGTGTIAIDLGAGTTATTVSAAYYGGTADSQTTELTYEVDEAGNLTYSVAAWSTQAGKTKYIKVVLADETSQVVAITIQ